ncbi:MAG: proline--tRNA ligase [archaeon]|nr:proline--tRNA ligase [archaeon]
MQEQKNEKVTFNIDKEKNFSEWFQEIVPKAELADIRYNVKGFIVYQPWSVISMEKIYQLTEQLLQKNSHKPYWFPAVIPEKNFHLEKEHVEGFSPEVFWVTEGGETKLEEKLALRPTSETAFYQMFALWIRSHNDLPLKTYQRAQVFRYETKATRPFLRSRELYWIETHCAFSSQEEAEQQVQQDMQMTKQILFEEMCIPFIFFERPQWDKFAGAVKTFAADALMPDGKVMQLPSTHLLGENFSKPFNVKFTDEKEIERHPVTTCWGPCTSRNFAAMIAVTGDNNGLIFPFNLAPVQVIIIPIAIEKNKKIKETAIKIQKELLELGLRVEIDFSDKKLGEKFYFWEMKGIPLRIEFGEKELKAKKATVFRRDNKEKKQIAFVQLKKQIPLIGKALTDALKKKSANAFEKNIIEANSVIDVSKALGSGKIAKANFCSIELIGEKCAEQLEKQVQGAQVRGIRIDKNELPKGNCIVCGKTATKVVYIARSY